MRGALSCEMSTTCVQGGIRPLGGYQPNMMIEPSSPDSPWPYPSVIPKAERRDHEERTDSGINSGSDFASSSPGSDHSETTHYSSLMPINRTPVPHDFYSTPRARPPVIYSPEQNQRLTPPVGEVKSDPMNQSPRPSCSSSPEENEAEDSLRKLQMSLEKNGFLPPSASISPKPSEYSIEDDNKSDNDIEEFDEQGLRIPRVNSHGKVKTYKCKQCDFVAITKLNFWEHTKGHIKEEKRLYCTKCPFVTEYKHHLEYHLRNHTGSKPYKCSQCNYSCVNKSMLNSHLKSHSNIYQYRCAECSYAAKYCHSLKLHLRKYGHKPAMVLNPDGTPNPLPIIDVYGTRRGPKMKLQEQRSPSEESSPNPEQILPFALNQFLPPQMQLPFPAFPFPFAGFPGALHNPLLLQNLEKLARESQCAFPSQEPAETSDGALDLSKPEESPKINHQSRTHKLSSNDGSQSENDDDDDDGSTTMFSNVEVVENKDIEENSVEKEESNNNNNNKEDYCCQYCKINFGDPVLYTMHMGYHGYKNPFTCNMCGEECKDKVSFFLHIARTPHS